MYYVSKLKLKIILKPNFGSENIFVAVEKDGEFKSWLSN